MLDLVRGQPTGSGLVGRDQELAAVLDAVLGDEGPVSVHHVVGGDAGVGKTRFASALVDEVDSRGWRTLWGHCVDSESTVPYLPFSEALGRLASDEPEEFDSIVAEVPELAALLPGRRLLGRDRGRTADSLDQGVLFDAMHAALEDVAATRPTLLVIEDVHWAGRSTADLLTVLFTRPFRHPLCIVATSRSDDLHGAHPLRKVLVEWSRLPSVRRMELAALGDDEMVTLVSRLDPSLEGGRLADVVSRAAGNPFFAEELTFADATEGLPTDLSDLLLIRLEELSADQIGVVRATACAGRRVSHRLLSAVVDGDQTVVDRALRAAVETNLLVPVGEDSYGFRHALLGEAVYDDLLPGERVALHARYAARLAEGAGSGTAAELARHARLGGDSRLAVRASVAAGDEALEVGGPDEAAGHYETALELLAGGVDPGPDITLTSLRVRAGRALEAAGRVHRALRILSAPLDQPEGLSAHERALLHLTIAELADDAGADVEEINTHAMAVAHSQQALDLSDGQDSTLLARASELHARILMRGGQLEEAAALATGAARLAEKSDQARVGVDARIDLLTIRFTRITSRGARFGAEELTDVLAEVDRLDQEAARIDYLDGRLRILNLAAFVCYHAADAEGAHSFNLRIVDVATAARRPWTSYAFTAHQMLISDHVIGGRFEAARELMDAYEVDSPPSFAVLVKIYRAWLACLEGDVEAAERLSMEVSELIETHHLAARATGVEAIAVRRGLDDAWTWYTDTLAAIDRSEPRTEESVNWESSGRIQLAGTMMTMVNDHVSDGDRGHWAARVEQMVADMAAVTAARDRALDRFDFLQLASAWAARFDVEVAVFRGEEPTTWPEVIAGFDASGYAYEAARSRIRSGIPEEVATGRRALEGMGAIPHAEPAARDAILTDRENEVLALVAEGLSNGAIGKRLFISPKTASVHVSNILAKLQLSSRTQAAAHYHRSAQAD